MFSHLQVFALDQNQSQNTRVVFCLSKFEVTAVNFECCSDLCDLLITPKSRARGVVSEMGARRGSAVTWRTPRLRPPPGAV